MAYLNPVGIQNRFRIWFLNVKKKDFILEIFQLEYFPVQKNFSYNYEKIIEIEELH